MGPSHTRTRGSQHRLPELLRPLFWDHDFERLDWDLHRSFIMGRVLAAGTWEAVAWLRTQLGHAALKQWIQEHEGRVLTSQQLRFWELVLGLPHDDVNRWLAQSSRRIWHDRVAR